MSFTIAFTKPSVVYTSLITAGLRPALIAVAAVIGPMQAILVLPNSSMHHRPIIELYWLL